MEEILKNLKKDGLLLKKIAKKDHTIEICRVAIHQNPNALKFASKNCVDYEICLNAVKKDGDVFPYVPKQLITENMCRLAVSANAELLNNVPENFRTNDICLLSIKNNVSTLSYISQEKRYELFSVETPVDLLEKVVNYNKSWITYVPVCKKTVELCIEYMKQDFSISQFLPKELKQNREILEFQKSVGKLKFIYKIYNEDSRIFLLKAKVVYGESPSRLDESKISEESYTVTVDFQDFDDFYRFLDGNLSDAELRSYDFKGIDLRQYNIESAVIHSDILSEQGLYNDEFYYNLKKHIEKSENRDIMKNEICIQTDFCYSKLIDDENDRLDNMRIPFFYISDIHLCHRVINKFKGKATKEEICSYVKFLARKMIDSIGTIPYNSYLLIAGDTSSYFEITKIFFGELVHIGYRGKIVVVSGNHELWDPYIDLEDNIQAYRAFFNELGITYLQNDLLLLKDRASHRVINEDQILGLDEEAIRKLVECSPVVILGGIGFSGLNGKYNAVNMRYGKTFEEVAPKVAIQRDIHESNRIDAIYKKLLSAIPKNKVIVLTHMMKSDWNAESHNPHWIYIYGHNHQNYFEKDNKRVIYADNQIGYRSQNVGLKYFYIDNEYDIFTYYQDGIYEISKEQYTDFNQGKRIQMSFNRDDGTIYMIKKKEIYMFFLYCKYSKWSKNKYLYLMNGGKPCKLIRSRLDDINFYCNNLEKYIENVHKLLDRYTSGQREMSAFIKRLGGSGRIHGCIVDVERPTEPEGFSYCHLFVNPINGKVTPYFAYDVKSRIVYSNLKSMLESCKLCKILEDNYLSLEKESKSNLPVVQYSTQLQEWGYESSVYDDSSYIYKISKIIKSLQYVIEKNVVRIWNEQLLNYDLINHIRQANVIEDMVDDALVVEIEGE